MTYDQHDRIHITMNGAHHRRALQLKRRIRRIDDLFQGYVESHEYRDGYADRMIKAKQKCRNTLGIYLECMIYED